MNEQIKRRTRPTNTKWLLLESQTLPNAAHLHGIIPFAKSSVILLVCRETSWSLHGFHTETPFLPRSLESPLQTQFFIFCILQQSAQYEGSNSISTKMCCIKIVVAFWNFEGVSVDLSTLILKMFRYSKFHKPSYTLQPV